MTTVTKTPVAFLANVATTALSSTKAAPNVSSGWIDLGAYDGGDMGLSVVNSGSAPTTAGSILIQWSPDNGTTIYDYQPMAGDTTASSINTATIWIDPGLRYVRVIGYGNVGNNVTFGATFSGVTRA